MNMEALATRYRSTLLAFFSRRTENAWDAEELTQEVFVKILNCQISAANCREPYLFAAAWSVLRDRNRRNLVRLHDRHISLEECGALLEVEDPATPDRIVDAEQLFDRLVDELEELHPREKITLIEHRFEHRTYRQIARFLGVSESAVEKYMSNALSHLRETVNTH